jgi:hypothetical protein
MHRRDPHSERRLWQQTLAGVRLELARLPAAERAWIGLQVARIADLQERLHALFTAAEGESLCRDCDGACCGCGRNHLTLGNLAAILLAGDEPPTPDFTGSCPWLGPRGCRLEPARRPFNCVTFICETIEDRIEKAELDAFYALEKALRCIYRDLAGRYAGAGLQGLLLRAEGLDGRGFFSGT